MNRLVLLSSLFFTFSCAKGERYNVPEWQWVEVEDGKSFKKETCGIDFGNYVKIIGEYNKKNLLVKYYTNVKSGSECRTETTFLISKKELLSWNKKYNHKLYFLERKNSFIRKLLNK